MENSLTILLYHGVSVKQPSGIENYSGKHIKQEDFSRQMSFIKKNCAVLSIDDVVKHCLTRKPFPDKAVTVTFDDGFKNNYTIAAPILNELKIPAVFYISTGFIGNDNMFWVDILEDSINRCSKLEINITLSKPVSISLSTGQDKIKAIDEIKKYCKQASTAQKDRVLGDVQKATGITGIVSSSDNYRKMDWPEVRELDLNPLFTIGGHTQRHNILSALPKDEMKIEISRSLKDLEKNLNHKIVHYSYPEGQRNHYNQEVIDALKEEGILCCPSAVHGINSAEDDLFHLKRIMVGFQGTRFPFS